MKRNREKGEINLLELQGLIANCCIENEEHRIPLLRCRHLIDTFGPLRTVDADEALDVLYRRLPKL